MMTNWQTGKYVSIIDLQNDAAKNSMWRSISALTLRANDNRRGDNRGIRTKFTPSFKKLNGSNGSFMATKVFILIQKNGLRLRPL